MPLMIAMRGVEWVSEPTSRGYRWVANMPRHWLIVFGDDHPNVGSWCIIAHAGQRPAPLLVAEGAGERDVAAAKLRTVAVYSALTDTLSDASATL